MPLHLALRILRAHLWLGGFLTLRAAAGIDHFAARHGLIHCCENGFAPMIFFAEISMLILQYFLLQGMGGFLLGKENTS